MNVRILLSIFILVTLSGLIYSPFVTSNKDDEDVCGYSSDYVVLNSGWKDFPITFKFLNGSLIQKNEFRDAVNIWQSAFNIDVFKEATLGDANLTVIFGDVPSPAAGVTELSQVKIGLYQSYSTYSVSAQIKISDSLFKSKGNTCYFDDRGIDYLTASLHELGHVLGLDHVNNVNDVMNYYIGGNIHVLSNGNYLALHRLYGDVVIAY